MSTETSSLHTSPAEVEAAVRLANEQKKITKYSVGFAFNEEGTEVVLILKNRPKWQNGYLNGVGGHIEEGESAHAAQAREFEEETGVKTYESNWKLYAIISGPGFELNVFSIFTQDIYNAITKTDEEIKIVAVNRLYKFPIIKNLTWLIPAAIDSQFYDGKLFIRVTEGLR
jgi:8-oxo-dGTP diphosphatase